MSDRNYAAIRSAEKAVAFIERCINSGKPIAFDIEAGYVGADKEGVALQQFHPDYIVVGISFTVSTEWARYIPLAHDDGNNVDDIIVVARALWRMLRTGRGVAHNAAYELKGMSRWFREVLWDDPEVGEEVRESLGFFPILSDTMIEVCRVRKRSSSAALLAKPTTSARCAKLASSSRMFLSSALRSVSTITRSTSFSLMPGLKSPCRRSASQQMESVLPLPAE